MARCLSTLSQGIIVFLNRRAYFAVASATEKKTMVVMKSSNTTCSTSASISSSSLLNSWVPDLVTGYYSPNNVGPQVDAAKLQEKLLSR
ncbi:late embryogenesis abundant protein Lea5-D-like [Curcuma longa]|uniref:late embryogenesis abundant protein Lea5-D-like n=1 Tax=Curcuma longa TaxID=136217 RepID=UPI003D9E3123